MIAAKHARCRPFFLLTLLLVTASSFNWQLQAIFSGWPTQTDNGKHLLQFVPERLRSFVAARFWARADEMMHRGSLPGSQQQYIAGSYSGNSDIVPLLQVVITLMPEELAPCQLLSRCLASLGSVDAGLRVIQNSILGNQGHISLHELYASAAYLKLFSGDKPGLNEIRSASRYLEKAAAIYDNAAVKFSSDPAFNASSYQVLLARLYLELDQPETALQAWAKSGQDLDASQDRLAVLLRGFRDNGSLPEEKFPAFLNASAGQEEPSSSFAGHESAAPEHRHTHAGHDETCSLCSHENSQTQETPPGFQLVRLFHAGFLLALSLIILRVRTRG
ncbi:MAG: hypothetical protein PHD82_03525 [Candidatus Riflebacteria bacterium]|nr:hypothetical protein [Candidatus Riflebacteria bacterium]